VMGGKSADALDPDGGAPARPVYMVGPPQRGPSKYIVTGPDYVAEVTRAPPKVTDSH